MPTKISGSISSSKNLASRLLDASRSLSDQMRGLSFSDPVTHVYNPLQYAWKLHQQYVQLVQDDAEVLFLGMNPGPWGMAQTGVPFGEVAAVRDWLGIQGEVSEPNDVHPKRPIEGLQCPRSEVSGRRLWGLMQDRFGSQQAFFRRHFVVNYCPLVFMESSGRNRTPDKLTAEERSLLESACDAHLHQVLEAGQWKWLVGVGAFAEKCFQRVVPKTRCQGSVCRVLHPSPASPAANRDWAGTAEKQLKENGVW